MTESSIPSTGRKARRTPLLDAHPRSWGRGFFLKLALMAMVDALGIYGLFMAWQVRSMVIVAVLGVLLLAANAIYFSRRMVPGKYLYPGMAFLLIFQVFVMVYTASVSFTNYGQGHLVGKDAAIASILAQEQVPVEDSPAYPVTIMTRGNDLHFAIVLDGVAMAGSDAKPLSPLDGAVLAGDRVESAPGYDVLADFASMAARQKEITDLRVPLSDDPEDGTLRSTDAQSATIWIPSLDFDEISGTMTDRATGVTYRDLGKGEFAADDGTKLAVGWRTGVGFKNYLKLFTDPSISKPFAGVMLWTISFAFLSVGTTFLLGLLLALVFNNPRLRGQKIYRVLLILPYAFPGFMSALLWRAMLNTSFGVINQTILGGASVGWLENDWLARLAVIGVNLWLGYPYMFLVCTGALQSIPGDMMESARVDGASPFRQFRSITLPLLFISVAPLLISSFAFNFNNFNLIFMLTGGGPVHGSDMSKPGATDILISMVYRVAGVDTGTPDYGLATALSLLIFIVVGAIAAWSFRQTRKLEEMV
ncbi:MAG: ABC transporter permease subunit [Micrococcales bacterium]|nr:ABC transporter permease subunit [Micrococcales bacterium]